MTIAELYKRVSGGDTAAREQLYQQLYVSFRVIARHRIKDWNEAEEVVQAAMVKVSTRLDQLADVEGFAAWAHKILRNEVIDYYRGEQTRRRRETDLEDVNITPPSRVEDHDLKIRLKECLKKLNAGFGRHARILNMRYAGYDTREICSRLGVTPNNLYVMLCRARTLLKQCLESGEIKS